jgi:hypothetical protein
MFDLCHRTGNCYRLCGAVLGYVNIRRVANIKLVEVIGEHAILCDWKDPG